MNLRYTNINVECSDLCNMRCIMCNQHHNSGFMHGKDLRSSFLPREGFVKLLNDIRHAGLDIGCFTPYWSGESTFHPDFKFFMKTLFERNRQSPFFKRFIFNTNGLAFDRETSDIFLDYAMYIKENKLGDYNFNLTFSLDSITTGTFSKIKCIKGGFFRKVMKNIDYLITKRSRLGLSMPNVTFSFVIMNENVAEAGKFLKYWSGYLAKQDSPFDVITEISHPKGKDAIFFRTCDDSRQKYADENLKLKRDFLKMIGLADCAPADTAHMDLKSHMKSVKQGRRPCFQLWNMCIISTSGEVTPCCKDNFLQLSLGSIKDTSIGAMWLGDNLKELRLSQIRGEFDQCKFCSTCMNPPGGTMRDDEVVSYLNLINEPGLIGAYLNRVRGVK